MSSTEIVRNSTTCRCCLSQTMESIDIFNIKDDINTAEALHQICGIEISPQDNLPYVICESCMHILKICHNFRIKTQQSDQTLQNILDGNIAVVNEESENDEAAADDTSAIDMKIESIEDSTSSLTCPYCSKAFVHRRNLQIHKQRHFMRGKYGCPSCAQRFHTKFDLLRHTSTLHLEDKPYICDVCTKRFPTQPELNRHTRLLHNPIKSFSCSQCGMQFKLKANAEQHIHLVHNKERSHICGVCGKSFAYESKLRVHQKSSKCERPIGISVVEVIGEEIELE